MVDRAARNCIIQAIDAYTSGRINSRAFDRQLQEGIGQSRDRAIMLVSTQLWAFYDDYIDHPAHLSKPQWDYVQRLRLVLMSDVELCDHRKLRAQQPVALVGLMLLCAVAWFHGVDWGFWLIDMFIGGVAIGSMYLGALHRPYTYPMRLIPFNSLREVLLVRRHVPGFRKKQYPGGVREKPLRGPVWSAVVMLTSAAAFSVLAPLPLFFCILPTGEIRVKMRTSGPSMVK